MSWKLEHTDTDNRTWRYDLDCTLDYATFASAFRWDEEGNLIYPNDNTSDRMEWLASKGITEERFNELRQPSCGDNLVMCSDPNTVFVNYGKYKTEVQTCKSRNCRCVCKKGYQPDSSGKCVPSIKSQSDAAEPVVSPAQIIGGVGVAIGLIALFTIFTRKGEDNSV